MSEQPIPVRLSFGPNDRRAVVIYRGKAMQPWRAKRIQDHRLSLETLNSKGYSIRETAAKLNRSIYTVRQWIQVLGLRWRNLKPKPHRKVSKAGWVDSIHAGARQGMHMADLARTLGADTSTVCRYCKAQGINWKNISKEASRVQKV